MFRLASLFAVACLTLAATALIVTPQTAPQEPQPDKDNDDELINRSTVLATAGATSYHARFSLN